MKNKINKHELSVEKNNKKDKINNKISKKTEINSNNNQHTIEPEIDVPIYNPEKTEKKMPIMGIYK